jgi:hypothetical protein
MQVIRRFLSVVLVLAFALGTTAQAAQIMSMKGMIGDAAATLDMGMSVASAPICPDCDDMDQGTMDMTACQNSICVVPSLLPPEAPLPASVPAASPVPYDPALGWGETLHPEPYPPKSALRL